MSPTAPSLLSRALGAALVLLLGSHSAAAQSLVSGGSSSENQVVGSVAPSSVSGRLGVRAQVTDERAVIMEEYRNRGIPVPARDAFASEGGNRSFSFEQLNSSDHSNWAIIDELADHLVAAVLEWRQRIQNETGSPSSEGFDVSSGYRCPERNDRVGGVRRSLHQYGRAVDVDPQTPSQLSTTRSIELLTVAFDSLGDDHKPNVVIPYYEEGVEHVHAQWEVGGLGR